MKICFLIADMSGKGGTERVTAILANGLAGRQNDVDVISCRNGSVSYFKLDERVEICSLHAEAIKSPLFRKLSNYRKIWKIVCNKKYDVVIAVDIYLFLYIFPLQIMGKCKCVAWEHFNYYISSAKSTKIARKLAVRYADQVVVLGKNDLENYQRNYKKAKNITYIYNPVNFEKTVNKNIYLHRIIAAGRLTSQKGFDLLLEAWNLIEKSNRESDWILDIFGEGKDRKRLEDYIRQQGLKRVHLKGYADDIREEYLNSSIYVLASRYEGFVLVLIEAFSCGLPCVSFDCKEGPSEIIADGVNGFLVETGNVNQLADKIQQLMENEELRKRFSENTFMDLDRFNKEKVLDEWICLLNKIIND